MSLSPCKTSHALSMAGLSTHTLQVMALDPESVRSQQATTEWVRVVHQITWNCLDLFVSLSGSSNSITFNMHNNSNSIIAVNNNK